MTKYPLGSKWKRRGFDDIYILGRTRDYIKIPGSYQNKKRVAFIVKRRGKYICWASTYVHNPDNLTYSDFIILQNAATFKRIEKAKRWRPWTK